MRTGLGRGARDGALIRDAESLQHLENANTLAGAETGTLTEGRPKLRAAIYPGGIAEERRLSLAAGIERPSEPLRAPANGAMDRGADLDTERRACTCMEHRRSRVRVLHSIDDLGHRGGNPVRAIAAPSGGEVIRPRLISARRFPRRTAGASHQYQRASRRRSRSCRQSSNRSRRCP